MEKITRKQCEEALKLAERCEYWYYEYWDKFGETEEYQVLEQVVKTYFELLNEYKGCRRELEAIYEMIGNPSLKFEELKEDMWVWDNKEKEWLTIQKILTKKDCQYLYHDENKKVFMTYHAVEFEEGRFFRKQVEE